MPDQAQINHYWNSLLRSVSEDTFALLLAFLYSDWTFEALLSRYTPVIRDAMLTELQRFCVLAWYADMPVITIEAYGSCLPEGVK